ncbi:MAG: hypothetical protein KJ981_03355 [Alphaproteobacteria bacterium]|uniref:hypothetical protein n=1 Tax=unclassified Agrobacterium TaxID=2632611 RepID=UPI0012376D6D|nr:MULTISPECIES: hypothetical protein [unclassified Agrobacterium]MBU0737822.1 hypothetical protein [Alphaproteobacteria bacterium]MBU0833392.1 hypothetical protein [Alphaproteobacteria bacterium]MBU1762917.1 hypothetical protein [Alphaproteobacteria bacterium]QGG91436.1 hypothetical protein GH983_13545 [Agrobacterium sp. MA01]
MAPYAIRIQSLPDLKAATNWLTNSDSLWQGVSNLLSKDISLLILHVFPVIATPESAPQETPVTDSFDSSLSRALFGLWHLLTLK